MGGGDPRSIGEQYNDTPKNRQDDQLQRTGNTVLVEEILERYKNNSDTQAILLDSCYSGQKPIQALSQPVFYVNGLSTLSDLQTDKFRYSEPGK